MKKIILLLLALLIVLCGCSGRVKGYGSVQNKLMSMQSYKADVEITYLSSQENVVYKAVQTAVNDGRYKMVTYYPDSFKDNAILFDGKMIWQYNPNVEKKISVNSQDKPERSQLILFSFIENYVKSTDTTVTTANTDGSECTVLEANIEGTGKYISSEKLWLSNEDMTPKKLVIYDADGKERISVIFNSFEYNCKIEENEFVPQK